MYFPLPGTLTRNPNAAPSSLPWSMIQLPSVEPSGSRSSDGTQAPSRSESEAALEWRRFVNHAESGTSSRLLTFTASPETVTPRASDTGRKKMWSRPDQNLRQLGRPGGTGDVSWIAFRRLRAARQNHRVEVGVSPDGLPQGKALLGGGASREASGDACEPEAFHSHDWMREVAPCDRTPAVRELPARGLAFVLQVLTGKALHRDAYLANDSPFSHNASGGRILRAFCDGAGRVDVFAAGREPAERRTGRSAGYCPSARRERK